MKGQRVGECEPQCPRLRALRGAAPTLGQVGLEDVADTDVMLHPLHRPAVSIGREGGRQDDGLIASWQARALAPTGTEQAQEVIEALRRAARAQSLAERKAAR